MRAWILGVLLITLAGSLSACASNQTPRDSAAARRVCAPYTYYTPYPSYCGVGPYGYYGFGYYGYYDPFWYGSPYRFYPHATLVYPPIHHGLHRRH